MATDGDTFTRIDRFRTWEAELFLGEIPPDVNENDDIQGHNDMMLYRVFSVWTLTEIILPALLYAALLNATIIFAIFIGQIIF